MRMWQLKITNFASVTKINSQLNLEKPDEVSPGWTELFNIGQDHSVAQLI